MSRPSTSTPRIVTPLTSEKRTLAPLRFALRKVAPFRDAFSKLAPSNSLPVYVAIAPSSHRSPTLPRGARCPGLRARVGDRLGHRIGRRLVADPEPGQGERARHGSRRDDASEHDAGHLP